MPTVTIDEQELEFEPGETIIELATRSNIEIPYYCWHPRLSVAANCRMCLVEVEKAPKLLPACQTSCGDGMVVRTENERVKEAQRAVQEFMLVNHPIDCPICDQAGECKLQDYYMKFHLQKSRMDDRKTRLHKAEPLGPNVIYDAQRCIMCTRCVRFMSEVAGDRQLGVFQRGDHAYIGTFPGRELDSPYSMNTIDICPVGALTSRAFRFKQRVWNLTRSESLCGGCGRGCNIHVDQRSTVVYRVLPRENEAVNKEWMCDAGRLTYDQANDNRLTQCLERDGDGQPEISAAQGLKKAANLLGPVAEAQSGFAVALSLHATCEEAYLLARLAVEGFGAETIALLEYGPWEGDDLLRVADRNPNRAGIVRVLADLGVQPVDTEELQQRIADGAVKALLVVGHQSEARPSLSKAAAKLEVFVHIAHAKTELADAAAVTLAALPWVAVDGTWVNVDHRAQRLRPAFGPHQEARPVSDWVLQLAEQLGMGFELPSLQTVRAEMQAKLPSFADSNLTEVGSQGTLLPAKA